jgi:hypothetical protein
LRIRKARKRLHDLLQEAFLGSLHQLFRYITITSKTASPLHLYYIKPGEKVLKRAKEAYKEGFLEKRRLLRKSGQYFFNRLTSSILEEN